jgi:hypothetical protein
VEFEECGSDDERDKESRGEHEQHAKSWLAMGREWRSIFGRAGVS